MMVVINENSYVWEYKNVNYVWENKNVNYEHFQKERYNDSNCDKKLRQIMSLWENSMSSFQTQVFRQMILDFE